jgi:acrylyl-CoA reductase (NADPH)
MRGSIERRSATREEGRRVLAEEHFDHVVFTGSTAVGRAIAEVCAPRLIPTTLELSGSDSAFVLADADARAAARAVFMGFTANAGQTCMAPRRALVMREAYAAFCDELARLVAGAKRVTLVDAGAAEAAQRAASAAISAGGRSIAGALEPVSGRTMRPAAVLDCPSDGDLFAGRHFGPAIAVVRVVDTGEALELHRRSDQHLTASVFTAKPARAAKLVPYLGATSVMDRSDLSAPGKPLAKERWAGVVDSVGSHTLANACASTKYGGAVAACGLAGGMDFPASVAPFILRGITLYGIDSVMASQERRNEAWKRLSTDLDLAKLEAITTEIKLDQAVAVAGQLLQGKVRGRVVVNLQL